MHSIRFKITAITVAAILTSVLFVFAASFVILRSETDQNSVAMMNLINEDTQKTLEKYFEGIEQSVEVAANIAVEDLDSVLLVECGALRTGTETKVQTPEQQKTLDTYLKGYCEKIQEFFSGVADYTQGVSAYYYCISPDVSQNERGFFYMKIGKTGFIEQTPLDVQHLAPVEALHASWYDAAVSKGWPCWLGPYVSAAQPGTWICSYFVPIYKSGMLIGLMGMDIPCETLVAQIEDIRVYDTGYVCLVNGEGRVIYHPDLPIGSSLEELDLSIHAEMLQEDSSGDELILYKVGGEDRQLSFSTLSNGMKLAAIAPTKEINAPWITLIRDILLIAAAAIVLYAILITVLVKAITSPLKELTDASQRLADKDYDVDLNYRGEDEIGTLTGSFKRMRDQIRQSIDDLNHQIYHDRLTDLPNMRHFFTLAGEEGARLKAVGKQPAMIYFDIIGLSQVNRQAGFEKGDEILRTVSRILTEVFGKRCVCRFGGDHFAAVADEERVEELVSEVFQKCENAADGQTIALRVGVYPDRLEDVDVNIACDRAKYAGQQNRGEYSSSITWFTDDMRKRAELYRYIINNVDRALREGWVKVYYQPIIRAADGKICDEEALARWIDPSLGFLSPAEFIPALEQSKLIYKLDLYVLEQVLEKMKQQAEAGFYVVPQSVNLSRMDFESCDIVEEIRKRVDAAGIGRSMITVEITESVIGGDFDFMKEQVARFQALGFPVWMDDFGSGYSSLDVLQQIHFDLIKFDMRFMERFDEGEESRIILTELMNMAIGLGTETVCEGVETAEQAEFLREIGCTRIQGYYYGKPLPFEGIVSLFEKGTTLEFENPAESEYYAQIGRFNLYDMSALASENDESLSQYFNTLPMCILEVSGTKARYNRCNRSYRDFLEGTLGIRYSTDEMDLSDLPNVPETAFFRAVLQCSRDGTRVIVDDRTDEHTVSHTLIRRVAVNPVTGTAAVAVAVLALTSVDIQEEIMSRFQTEKTVFSRISALLRDFICIYTINPETGHYIEYRASSIYAGLGVPAEGDDFFKQSQIESLRHIYPDDREKFQTLMTKENILSQLEKNGIFAFRYRLMLDGEPRYVYLRAALVSEQDGTVLLIAVNDIDAQVKQEQDYERKLAAAGSKEHLDTLTGVKDRTAYENMSEYLSRQIEDGESVRYAIVLCRVSDLGRVNETKGREAGNRLIREVCDMICGIFKHSPVFRVAGDQFAVLAQGHDYEWADKLVVELAVTGRMRGLAVSSGMAKYDGAESVAEVFARAERQSREEES